MDKEKLLAPRNDTEHGMPEADVEIPNVGTVKVRGLTRGEVFKIQQAKGTAAIEAKILAIGMVDPELTDAEVRRWQGQSPAGELDSVVEKIRELSGLSDRADKEAYKSFRDGSGDGVRTLPGDEAFDDSDAASDGDA